MWLGPYTHCLSDQNPLDSIPDLTERGEGGGAVWLGPYTHCLSDQDPLDSIPDLTEQVLPLSSPSQ